MTKPVAIIVTDEDTAMEITRHLEVGQDSYFGGVVPDTLTLTYRLGICVWH